MEKKLQNAIDTLKKALSLSEIITALIAPEKVLRENLTPSEAESAALLTKNNIPLPESFYTVTIPAALVQTGIDTLKSMIPSKKGKGGGRAAGSTEPVKACPYTGWLNSKRSNLRRYRKTGSTSFPIGERERRLFPATFSAFLDTDSMNPQDINTYNDLMAAYEEAVKRGGSKEQ